MRRKKDSLYQAKQELLREIEEVKTSLAIAHSNFDNVNDPDLVDSCIYEMTAIQYKYKYLRAACVNLKERAHRCVPSDNVHSLSYIGRIGFYDQIRSDLRRNFL